MSKQVRQHWPSVWKRLGAVAAGMCTVLGSAAIFSALRPHASSGITIASPVVTPAAAPTVVTYAEAPSSSSVAATPPPEVTPPPETKGKRVKTAAPRPSEASTSKPGEIPRVSRQGGVTVVNPWAKP